MEPTVKAREIEDIIQRMFNINRATTITNNMCVAPPIGCGKPIGEFRDTVSEREYRISGLCQKCQDSVFSS